ncbi:glycosyltransferase 87 family protein [Actinoplanes sp. NPDC051513]|uniref:glycosyltransferase 87 family protein n=1 Tax=Actinoplanes sp. NPDC051513 TaxID=3363908 RepID=UPI00379C9D78
MPAKHARSVVVALAGLAAGSAILFLHHAYGVSTLAASLAAVRDWQAGDRLDAPLTAPAALLISPLSLLPLRAAAVLTAVTGVVALVLALVALAGPVARRYGRPRFPIILAAVLLALAAAPVRATLGLGCLDLLLFGLVTADVIALRRAAWARSRATWWPDPSDGRPPARLRRMWATGAWAGLGTGIATALAIGPCLFIVYFAVTRQWRAAVTATITALTVLGAALLVAPGPAPILPGLARSGPFDVPDNQSLAGVLARLYDSTSTPVLIWLSFAGLLMAVGMIRARSAHHDGDEIAACTLIGLTGAAVGPISRVHSLIWLLPAVLILIDAAARRRTAARRPQSRRFPGAGFAAAAVLTYVLLVADPRWTAGGNGYAFILILLLNALPWRPGVAPAVPVRRRPQQLRRAPAIPGPRGR